MKWGWEAWTTNHQKKLGNIIILTLFISVLLVGLVLFHSSASHPLAKPSAAGRLAESRLKTSVSQPWVSSKTDKCDVSTGKWVPNLSGPAYTNSTCHFIPDYVNCLNNGRPDRGYLLWRWKPDGCDLRPFDADVFLNIMRNKNFAVIGDSISENHFDTLKCLLSKAEEPVLIYRDKEYHYRRWYFLSHNFTLSIIWSPMLAQAEGTDGTVSVTSLHLDTLDRKWTDEYDQFDYVIISTGQWFLIENIFLANGTVIGCNFCPGKNLPELGWGISYRTVLRLVFSFVDTSAHKPVVWFRSWSPTHNEFENDKQFCNRTRPYNEGEYNGIDNDHIIRGIELEEFGRAAAGIGERLKLLDTFPLSLMRPDGHPGPYRTFEPFSGHVDYADCTHWCVPGAIDSWNDLLMHIILEGEGVKGGLKGPSFSSSS